MQQEGSDALSNLEGLISNQIRTFIESHRCSWCGNPERKISNKKSALCSSCLKWSREERRLSGEVALLPPRLATCDPHAATRRELDVAQCAISLCKCEGEVREAYLYRTDTVDPVELECEFDDLGKRLLGIREGCGPFAGHAHYFHCFSATQRLWLWCLLQMILDRRRSWDRRSIASGIVSQRVIEGSEMGMQASCG